jgi:hypothetical protein
VKTFGELSYHPPPPDGLGWSRPLWRLQATSDVMLRLRRIFPRAQSHRTPYITIDHTPEVARDLEWMLDRWPLKISAADLMQLRAGADEHRQREEVVNEILTGDRPHLDLTEPARPARDYQLVAADLALVSGSLLLADDLGLGKSMSGLLVLRDQGLLLRRTRADVGRELPEVVRVPHSVSADEKVYERLMEGAVDLADIVLHGERKDAFVAAGELDWETRRATGVSKAPYVAEFIRMLLESQEKVVLFGWHRDVYDIWLDRLAEFNPVLYTGSESPAQKEESKRLFLEPYDEEDPEACRVFIMSLRSGAGLDGLQAVTNVAVFGELDWSPGMHDQCIGRLHRDGQDESVVAYFLNSEIGSDPVVMDVLGVKRMQSEPLRDPDAELVAEGQDTRGRVRKLAEDVVSQRKTQRAAA